MATLSEQEKSSLTAGGCVLVLVILGACAGLAPLLSGGDGGRTSAWMAAEVFISREFQATGTTDFGSQRPRDCVRALSHREYEVEGWVDVRNANGVTVRAEFILTVRRGEGGEWLLIGKPIIKGK